MSYVENTSINQELVLDFFLVLSRMEFALKYSGYATGNERRVNPDWNRFSDELKDIFDKSSSDEIVSACEYYLAFPPQKQIIINNSLGWSDTPPEAATEIGTLLLLIRRVRNNLFHGGKYNSQAHNETARNEQLLTSGMVILKESMRLIPQVEAAYNGAAI